MEHAEQHSAVDRKQTELEQLYEILDTNDQSLDNVYSRLLTIRDRINGPCPIATADASEKATGLMGQAKSRVYGQQSMIARIQEIIGELESTV